MVLSNLREDLLPVLFRLLQRHAGSLEFCWDQLIRHGGDQPPLAVCCQAACSQHLAPLPRTACMHGNQSSAAQHLRCKERSHLPVQSHSPWQQLLTSRPSLELNGPSQGTRFPSYAAAFACQPAHTKLASSPLALLTEQNPSASCTITLPPPACFSRNWRNFTWGSGTSTRSGPHGTRAPHGSPLGLARGQNSSVRGRSSSSSSSSNSNTKSAEALTHKKGRKQTLPTWLHILRRKRHAREKGRATAAVMRRAKRDGIMASPKGIRATSLTALRAAPVWPSMDTLADFGLPDTVDARAASPWAEAAWTQEGSSSSSSSSGSSYSRSKAPDPASAGREMGAGAYPADTTGSSSRAKSRITGKRMSQGRGGSASGRVWPMDPPELTEAISRCASLKGLAQILDVTEDMDSAGTSVSTKLLDRQRVHTPGLRLRAARLALQREMRALAAEREGPTRRFRRRSSMPIILTATFNQLAWLHTHSSSQAMDRPRSSAPYARDQEHALKQALLHWMFDQLSVVAPVLDARGASTIVAALGVLRQQPPPETWASLVDRLLEPLPTIDKSRGQGRAGSSSGNQSGPRTLVEAMDVAQLVDLSAGLARLRAGASQLWTAILDSAAAAATREEVAPSQFPLLLKNVKHGCGVGAIPNREDFASGRGSRIEGEDSADDGLGMSNTPEFSKAEASQNPQLSEGGVEERCITMSSARGRPAAEEVPIEVHHHGDRMVKGLGDSTRQQGVSRSPEHGLGVADTESLSQHEEDASTGHEQASGFDGSESSAYHDEEEAHLRPLTHTDMQSHQEAHDAADSPSSSEAHMELQRQRALLTLVAALPSLLPRMELKDIAATVAALRGFHLSLDPDVLRLLNQRIAYILGRRQERRQRQSDHAQLQQRLKEVAARVLRSRTGNSQGDRSSRTTSISASSEDSSNESRREDNSSKGSIAHETGEEEEDKADARAIRMLSRNLAALRAGNSKVWGLLRRG